MLLIICTALVVKLMHASISTSSSHWGSGTQAGVSMYGHVMSPPTVAAPFQGANYLPAGSHTQATMYFDESAAYAGWGQVQTLAPSFATPPIPCGPPAAFPLHGSFSSPSARMVPHPEAVASTPSDSGESCITCVDLDTPSYSKYEVSSTANTSTLICSIPASVYLSSHPYDTHSPYQPHPSQPASSSPAASAGSFSSPPRATQATNMRFKRQQDLVHNARHSPTPQLAIQKTSPRNLQVPSNTTPLFLDRNDFQCPYCEHYQSNRRRPDLIKHIKTHLQMQEPDADWVCCGVPMEKAALYKDKDISRVESFGKTGMLMVGGCGKTFTRKENYNRHLKRLQCVGDVNGWWLPGNM